MYFDRVLLTALGSPKVKRVEQVRRAHDATGRIGFMRYRLTLINDDLLELTERVEVQAGEIIPHHLHDGSEDNVVAHPPVDALQVLHLVVAML